MKKALHDFSTQLEEEFCLIPTERKAELLKLTKYITSKYREGKTPRVVVICTHNSRRSHIGQLWLAVGADHYQLPRLETFSGGTEATAFNGRAVAAFRRIGLDIVTDEPRAENPVYQVSWKEQAEPYAAFSKKYDEAPNPKSGFAAVLVCSEADAGCPFVPGCDFRLALPYDDPKTFDGTELEDAKYDERLRQIGREMLFTLSRVDRG